MTDNDGTANSGEEPIREAETEDDMISSISELESGRKVASTGLPDQLEQDLVQTFKLLSDETRLRVLMYLMREGELHVTALCERQPPSCVVASGRPDRSSARRQAQFLFRSP